MRTRWRWGAVTSFAATLLFLVTLNFFLPRAMPGDPVDALLSRGSTAYIDDEDTRAELVDYYGLDEPVVTQYARYLGRLGTGDLGVSIRTNAPVADAIRDRLPWSLLLAGTAVLLATAIGLTAGVHAGWRRGRLVDRGSLALFLGLREVPAFLLGSLALFLLAVKLDWFPLAGARSPFAELGLAGQAVDIAAHLVLPACVLAVSLAATQYLVMRGSMVSQIGADHLLLGQAKGLRDRRLKYRYAARNALLPVVSMTAVQLGFAVTGAIVVERVFAYPGLGEYTFESVGARDYPAIQGCFLVTAILIVSINALADVLLRRLDPRIAA